MLKVRLQIGTDYIDVSGDVALADVIPVIHSWLAALPVRELDDKLRALTARLVQSTTALDAAVRTDGRTS